MLRLSDNGQPRPTHVDPLIPAVVSDSGAAHRLAWAFDAAACLGCWISSPNLEGLRWVLAGFAPFRLLADSLSALVAPAADAAGAAMPTRSAGGRAVPGLIMGLLVPPRCCREFPAVALPWR